MAGSPSLCCQHSVISCQFLLCVLCAPTSVRSVLSLSAHFLSGARGSASAGNFFALLLPAEDGFTYARHRFHGFDAGALGAGVDQFEHAARILLVLHAAFADWRDPLDQV